MPREVIDYKTLAERIELYASLGVEGCDRWRDDLRTVATMLKWMADEKPALWMQSNHVSLAGKQPFMARCAPTQLQPDFVPLHLHPAPQPQPVLSGYGDYGAAIPGIEQPCTCHPDDNPPVPCAQKYALSECREAPQREPLSDERIAEIQRAAYERAAQECIETAAELRRCADGCTDGRYDWKADGALDCADAIRALKSEGA